jgi:Catalytic LigB subunit of aromatic ring-opening dioxygenase
MLELGLASSHAPIMFQPREFWPHILERLRPEVRDSLPHNARLELETPGIIESHIERIEAAFAELREQVASYRPDALILIGDDQGDMFDDANNPIFAIYTGSDPIWGRSARDPLSVPVEQRTRLEFPVHAELSEFLLKGLIKKGFDLANLRRFDPRGNPVRGVSHAVANLVPEVDPRLEIPLICIFLNEYYPPLPSAERCYLLGEAIAEVLSSRPERIAIYASGGLSHFPGMYNCGWIDEPLDRWILERLERNDHEALKHLFTFDSDSMRAGTGEIRAWISVAAAMKRPANVIDYVAAHCTVTGCGFACWPPVTESRSQPALLVGSGASRN